MTSGDEIISRSPKDLTAQYDRLTAIHESVHAINASIQRKHPVLQSLPPKTGIYLLGGEELVLDQPNISMGYFATRLPQSLRHEDLYQTYAINSQKWYQNCPLYLVDEWVAFTYTGIARHQENIKDGSYEVEHAIVMGFWVSEVCRLSNTQDEKLLNFVKNHWSLTLQMYSDNLELGCEGATEQIEIFKTARDCQVLREYIKEKFEVEFK